MFLLITIILQVLPKTDPCFPSLVILYYRVKILEEKKVSFEKSLILVKQLPLVLSQSFMFLLITIILHFFSFLWNLELRTFLCILLNYIWGLLKLTQPCHLIYKQS